jgi:hypothetical protein
VPYVLLVVFATSALAVALAIYRRVWSAPALGRALVIAVETVGAVTIFLAVNVAVGMTLVLAMRVLTPFYLSLYEVADAALLVLSALQALVYQGWRSARATSR